MKQKQSTRDLIYINGSNYANKYFYSYGIEFCEFMSCVPNRPENLILLKHCFGNAQWNQNNRFDYVTTREINELISENVHRYGDFCWVDFSKIEDIDKFSKEEIAELLFFGHLAETLNEIPKVRFAYYAHDDGWFNKLYVTELKDYRLLLSRVIVMKLRKLTGRLIVEIPDDISTILLETTKLGLYIDFSKISRNRTEIKIPIAAVGSYVDMDRVYALKDHISDYLYWLVFSRGDWKIIDDELECKRKY